jgi:hypothetical protein
MTYVVVASGNHFWLDAVLGLAAAAAAVGVAMLLARLHPDWSFAPLDRRARSEEIDGRPEPEAAPA